MRPFDRIPKSATVPRPGLGTLATPTQLQITTGRQLSGGWDDEAIEAMGHEDGQASLFTTTWGEGNGEPRVVLANNAANGTAVALIGQQLHEQLAGVERQLEALEPSLVLRNEVVNATVGPVARAEAAAEAMEDRLEDEDLGAPDITRHHTAKEVAALSALGLGDLILNATVLQVFGLSEAGIGILPINELQLAASVVVFTLMFLARCAGGRVRTATHLLGALLYHKGADEASASNRRRIVEAAVAGTMALLWIGGGIAVLDALRVIRESYLGPQGVAAQGTAFFMVQLGVFVAGMAISYQLSHPYEARWRAMHRRLEAARAALVGAVTDHLLVVAEHNGLIRVHESLLAQFREWALATTSDTIRQNQLYARRVLLAQPEPTVDVLFGEALPEPVQPALAQDVADHLAGTDPSRFKRYEPVTTTDIEDRLRGLDERRRHRHGDGDGDGESTYVKILYPTSNGTGSGHKVPA